MACQAPDRVSCVQGSTILLCFFFLDLQKDLVGEGAQLLKCLAYNQVDHGDACWEVETGRSLGFSGRPN